MRVIELSEYGDVADREAPENPVAYHGASLDDVDRLLTEFERRRESHSEVSDCNKPLEGTTTTYCLCVLLRTFANSRQLLARRF